MRRAEKGFKEGDQTEREIGDERGRKGEGQLRKKVTNKRERLRDRERSERGGMEKGRGMFGSIEQHCTTFFYMMNRA